ncbi:MAG: hypothetical protein R3E08_05160 [Thiotrichaceae bacterium]
MNLYATLDVWMAQLTEPYERGVTAEAIVGANFESSFHIGNVPKHFCRLQTT